MPSKSVILKRYKKMAHRPTLSPKGASRVIRKQQINRKGLVIHEIPTHVSRSSKKQLAEDMAKKIKKKKRRVVIEDEDEVVPDSPVQDTDPIISSPKKASPIPLNVEVTGDVDHLKVSTPMKADVIPHKISNTESVTEEVRTSGIPTNISNMDTNVNMGEGVHHNEAHGNPLIILSSTFDTSTISPTTSLPPFQTNSLNFENIIDQPITSLFSSQSIDPNIIEEDNTTKDGEFTGTFSDLEFDPEEENIMDLMLMSRKQFKILSRKFNSLLQLLADARGRNYVSGIEDDVMLKSYELRLRHELEQLDRNNEKRINSQSSTFNDPLKDLKAVSHERHILFAQDVKKVHEKVNLKIEELHEDMTKEIVALDHNYFTLHNEVDIVVDAVTKVFELYNSMLSKVDKKVEVDA